MGVFVASSGLNVGYLVIAMALVFAGWAVMFFASRRTLRHTAETLHRESEERIRSLEAEIRARSAQSASTVGSPSPVSAGPLAGMVQTQIQPSTAQIEKEEVTPDLLLVIAAAVTAFLGKKVRIRSARQLPNPEIFSAWAQQGRVFVQASHNLAQRGR